MKILLKTTCRLKYFDACSKLDTTFWQVECTGNNNSGPRHLALTLKMTYTPKKDTDELSHNGSVWGNKKAFNLLSSPNTTMALKKDHDMTSYTNIGQSEI
jgi:hypothetical protein